MGIFVHPAANCNPKPTDLGNDVIVWLPSWQALTPDGRYFEGKGIEPDVHVPTEDLTTANIDPVLTQALKLLRQ